MLTEADLEARLSADYLREVRLLSVVQREGAARELAGLSGVDDVGVRIEALAARLARTLSLDPEDVRYALESWGIALGVLIASEPSKDWR